MGNSLLHVSGCVWAAHCIFSIACINLHCLFLCVHVFQEIWVHLLQAAHGSKVIGSELDDATQPEALCSRALEACPTYSVVFEVRSLAVGFDFDKWLNHMLTTFANVLHVKKNFKSIQCVRQALTFGTKRSLIVGGYKTVISKVHFVVAIIADSYAVHCMHQNCSTMEEKSHSCLELLLNAVVLEQMCGAHEQATSIMQHALFTQSDQTTCSPWTGEVVCRKALS